MEVLSVQLPIDNWESASNYHKEECQPVLRLPQQRASLAGLIVSKFARSFIVIELSGPQGTVVLVDEVR